MVFFMKKSGCWYFLVYYMDNLNLEVLQLIILYTCGGLGVITTEYINKGNIIL